MADYNQVSFAGGMNLLLDDTRLQPNQYRVGFNLRNRYDTLDAVRGSVLDTSLPSGIIQEITTFGEFIIAFVSGVAWWRHYTSEGWQRVPDFALDISAPRYWTCQIPVGTTNYLRLMNENLIGGAVSGTVTVASGDNNVSGAGTKFLTQVVTGSILTKSDGSYIGVVDVVSGDTTLTLVDNTTAAFTDVEFAVNIQQASVNGSVSKVNIAAASGGNESGLLVQDNKNQPLFIYLNSQGFPVCKVTKTYDEWSFEYDAEAGTMTTDNREYVPVGNCMAFVDGVLYIVSQDFSVIYRSVSGRPLDFMVNVTQNGSKGGDVDTTAYSVGAGGISAIRGTSDGALFVAADNANFVVKKNMTPNAPTLFGEYTFIRQYLFEATCLNDRCIIDSLGDTKFIDLNGVRSFNAIQQFQNEGRNTPFTATIASAFRGIIQDTAAAIVIDNYELYAMNSVYGAVIAVYDTINNCWAAFDTEQTRGMKIKQFAKIDLGVQRLYAVTEDDKMYQLYTSSEYSSASFVTTGISSLALLRNAQEAVNFAQVEVKPASFRCVLNRITEDCEVTVGMFINNRISATAFATKSITYVPPVIAYADTAIVPDANTQLNNLFWMFPNSEQGWKTSFLVSWTGSGSVTLFAASFTLASPMNPPTTQANTK